MYFDELDLNDNVLDALYDMHFDTCTPVQEKCIPEILKGRDVLGVAQTGTGKTAAYLLPILSKLDDGGYPSDAVNCVIMAPTRELAQQIDQAMQGFGYYLNSVSSVPIYGGNDGNRYDQELKSLQLGADIVIATPGRFISHISLDHADLSKVSFFVLDEADRMLDMGFSEDIMTIAKHLPDTCQTIMFSATMPDKIEELAKTLLKNPVTIKLAVSKPAEKIKQSAYICHETQKLGILKHIFKKGDLRRVIIFSGKKAMVKQINHALLKMKVNSGEMHSDLSQAERDDMMFRFKSGQIDVLVATDILARGIDIDDIAMVINYDVPNDAEDYVHRIGRTARADRDGVAITFVNERDMAFFQQIEKFLGKTVEKNPMPEDMEDGPDYSTKKANAKNRRRKDRNNNAHRRKPHHGNERKEKSTEQAAKAEQNSKPSEDKPQEKQKQKQQRNNRRNKTQQDEAKSNKPAKKENDAAPNRNKNRKAENASITKPAAENKPKRKKRRKPIQGNANQQETTSKYAIREQLQQPKKKESGLKALVKKPLRWLGLGKK